MSKFIRQANYAILFSCSAIFLRFLSFKTHVFRKFFKQTSTTSSFNMSRDEQKNTNEKHTLEDLSIVWKELNLEDMEKT